MNNFIFHNPVQLYFGSGILDDLGKKMVSFGKKVLIVTSKFFARESIAQESGVLKHVQGILEADGADCAVFPNVEPNPRLKTVEEGIRVCRENKTDVLVALGGGSVVDCSKAIGFCVFEEGDLWDFFTGRREAWKSLPVICVSTVAASGSEMNANCVITNKALGQKYVTRFPCCYPKASFVDVELHKTLPAYNTACGMTDTITHVLEKYFDGTSDTPVQDRFAEGIVRTVIENEGVLLHPKDTTLRKNIALASIFGLNGMCDVGRGKGNFDAHTIELEVSARYNVAHGAGLAVIYPAWMRHLCRKNPAKFAQFARRVFDISGSPSQNSAIGMKGVDLLKEKFIQWGMPDSLKSLGVSNDELTPMSERIIHSPKGRNLEQKDVYNVLCDCHEKT